MKGLIIQKLCFTNRTSVIILGVSAVILVLLTEVYLYGTHHAPIITSSDPSSRRNLQQGPGCTSNSIECAVIRHTRHQPFFYFPGPLRKLKVLFLFHLEKVEKHLEQRQIFLWEAAKVHPLIEGELWGNGFQDWNTTLSKDETELVTLNILKKYGQQSFDVVMIDIGTSYHPVPPFSANISKINSAHFHEVGCKAGLCRCGNRLLNDLNVIYYAYATSLSYLLHYATPTSPAYAKMIYHLPLAADSELFCSNSAPERKREINALLVGRYADTKDLYPFRARLAQMIQQKQIPGGVLRDHPYVQKKKMTAKEQQIDYAEQMKNSKIVLVTRSRRNYALRKYHEAAMAGALLVGNVPNERQEEFRDYMVEINLEDTNKTIVDTIQWWVDHEEERLRRAKIGQAIACMKYTYKAFVDHMVETWNLYLDGMRGVHYPYQFSIDGALW